jgi:Mg-chelatase subunit ChlD
MSWQLPHSAKGGLWFELTVDATCELARDADQAAALVSVAARRGDGGAAMATRAVEIIIMDRSLSMHRHGKLREAKDAVLAAIDALSDTTYFAIIAGNHGAHIVYPPDGTLGYATAAAKRAARNRVAKLDALGGTAMGGWLRLAHGLFDQVPDAIRHAVLYTDGINEHETPTELDSALRACRAHFVCDVRGVGSDWEPRELRRIAGALQGEVEAIIDVADLRADFVRLMEHAQSLLVSRAYLRLSLDRHFRVESVRQIRPTENDLTGHLLPQDDGKTDLPLLAWGEESRDYLVVLRVEAGTPTEHEIRAARIDVVAGDSGDSGSGSLVPCAAPAVMVVRWLPHRGGLTWGGNGTTEAQDLMRLGAATRAGIAAYRQGDENIAVTEFTLAVSVARSLGASWHLERLLRLVTIDEFGGVRLRPDIATEDLLMADIGSTRHRDSRRPDGAESAAAQLAALVPAQPPPASARPVAPVPGVAVRPVPPLIPTSRPAEPALVSRTCPDGHVTVGQHVRHCEELGCQHEFSDDDD